MREQTFEERKRQLECEHKALVTRRNEPKDTHNGVLQRWKHPVLTADHAPLFWRYDLDPETNPYLQKFIKDIAWRPQHMAVFAGKIDYPRYGFVDRTAIRFIMWMTKGPTDPTLTIEFTAWDKVDEFARTVTKM